MWAGGGRLPNVGMNDLEAGRRSFKRLSKCGVGFFRGWQMSNECRALIIFRQKMTKRSQLFHCDSQWKTKNMFSVLRREWGLISKYLLILDPVFHIWSTLWREKYVGKDNDLGWALRGLNSGGWAGYPLLPSGGCPGLPWVALDDNAALTTEERLSWDKQGWPCGVHLHTPKPQTKQLENTEQSVVL